LPVVEPFSGTGALVRLLPELNWAGLYDIDPRPLEGLEIDERDTIASFPTVSAGGVRYGAVVTNPPWLARRAATARNDAFWGGRLYDDLYKEALAVCLANVGWVAAIVPLSFVTSRLFRDRLKAVVELTDDVFGGATEHPSCLALFAPTAVGNPSVWRGDVFLGDLASLTTHEVLALPADEVIKVRFHEAKGRIAVFALDARTGPTIRFALGDEVKEDRVKRSSRHVLRVDVDLEADHAQVLQVVECANRILADFRQTTRDVPLTAAKSRRRDGLFRRRLDFDKVARILTLAIKRSRDLRPEEVREPVGR
jgi:hypothetical protein